MAATMDPSRLPSTPAPSADALAHSERLAERIRAEIAAAGGWIGFDRYMELALYAPGLGYYAAGARKFGPADKGGDFVTAPEISPLFAQALAAQVAQVLELTAAHIVEFGAGTGRLARGLLAALDARGVAVHRYDVVELSAELRERQRALIGDARVRWLDAPPEAVSGVIVANEVLDVMPVRLFAREGGALRERGVALRDGSLAFATRPADPTFAAAVAEIEAEVGPLADGYGSELGLVARGWMRSAARWLARGALLAIDYGFPRRECYHPQRLMGTLMCHHRHHAHTDPLWLPGLNDITAHVDFTAMAQAAHEGGLDVLGFTSQAHFLLNCGLLDLLQHERTPQSANAAHRLISEAEMGELVKVLAVGRGVGVPLLGFARGDRTHTL
jgi:SAM-dependent MidA family methyltransferase